MNKIKTYSTATLSLSRSYSITDISAWALINEDGPDRNKVFISIELDNDNAFEFAIPVYLAKTFVKEVKDAIHEITND